MEVRLESKVVPKIIEFMEETKGKYELKIQLLAYHQKSKSLHPLFTSSCANPASEQS